MCVMEWELKHTSKHRFIYLLDLLLIYICEIDSSDFCDWKAKLLFTQTSLRSLHSYA